MRIGEPQKVVRVGTVAPPIPVQIPVRQPEKVGERELVPVERPQQQPAQAPQKNGG
jgi:hypothetical protein